MMSLDEVRALIEHKLAAMGLELYDVVYHRAGKHSILRVYVDKQAGVTIDDCEAASRELSVMLDVEDFSSGPYSLEVSSPGLDRPLRTERDYARLRGRPVVLEVNPPVAGKKRIVGVVQECGGGMLRLECDGEPVAVPLSGITQGKVELPF
jgi:ribosome maturation factor RimP